MLGDPRRCVRNAHPDHPDGHRIALRQREGLQEHEWVDVRDGLAECDLLVHEQRRRPARVPGPDRGLDPALEHRSGVVGPKGPIDEGRRIGGEPLLPARRRDATEEMPEPPRPLPCPLRRLLRDPEPGERVVPRGRRMSLEARPEAADTLERRASGLVGESGEVGVRQPGEQIDRGRADLNAAVGPAALEQGNVIWGQSERQRRCRESSFFGRRSVPVRRQELPPNDGIRRAQRSDDGGTSRGRRRGIPCGRRVADRPGHAASELRHLLDEPRSAGSEDRSERGTRIGVPAGQPEEARQLVVRWSLAGRGRESQPLRDELRPIVEGAAEEPTGLSADLWPIVRGRRRGERAFVRRRLPAGATTRGHDGGGAEEAGLDGLPGKPRDRGGEFQIRRLRPLRAQKRGTDEAAPRIAVARASASAFRRRD